MPDEPGGLGESDRLAVDHHLAIAVQHHHNDVDWRHSHEVSVGLHRAPGLRLDAKPPPGGVQHARIGAEILAE